MEWTPREATMARAGLFGRSCASFVAAVLGTVVVDA